MDPYNDTIVAPATAAGEGGIGIVRLSGKRAEPLLRQVFQPVGFQGVFESHRLYYGRILLTPDQMIDEGMAVLMRGPRSYTREDVAEIHCHGGSIVMGRVLDLFIDSGARLARPGEFTLRAFLNGRIDLAQAEAVIDIIRSRSDAARNLAVGQLEGKLSQMVHRFREEVAELLTQVEAHIDFPDEDIPPQDQDLLLGGAEKVLSELDRVLVTFDSGRLLREGLSVLILGKPNVGKSSLLNALLGESRAIVTEEAGTTRDVIEERLSLGGLPLRLVDTAGIRPTDNAVEREGVRRAREKVTGADLILLVVDGSQGLSDEDRLALEHCWEKRTLVVLNKSDLGTTTPPDEISSLPQIRISARTGEGLDHLKEAVVELFSCGDGQEAFEDFVLSDRRHREALVRGRQGLERFVRSFRENAFPEFQAMELREVLAAFGEITGETVPEEILNRIFSRFCVGK